MNSRKGIIPLLLLVLQDDCSVNTLFTLQSSIECRARLYRITPIEIFKKQGLVNLYDLIRSKVCFYYFIVTLYHHKVCIEISGVLQQKSFTVWCMFRQVNTKAVKPLPTTRIAFQTSLWTDKSSHWQSSPLISMAGEVTHSLTSSVEEE